MRCFSYTGYKCPLGATKRVNTPSQGCGRNPIPPVEGYSFTSKIIRMINTHISKLACLALDMTDDPPSVEIASRYQSAMFHTDHFHEIK